MSVWKKGLLVVALLSGTAISCRAAIEPKANLEGADLKGEDLTGADLTEANLRGAILTEAKLMGAKLMGAEINQYADSSGVISDMWT